MKKICAVLILALLVAGTAFAATPKFSAPIFITSAGQSVDGGTVDLLLKRAKINDRSYNISASASEVNWSNVKTLMVVIGGSGKGLGSAGLSSTEEVKRVEAVIASAKAAGTKIVALHIGGQDRRGANSIPFLPFAGEADCIIVNSNGNADGYFTSLAASKNIPFMEITKNSDLAKIFTEMFN